MDGQRHSALLGQIKKPPPLDDFERLCDALDFGPHMPIADRRDLVDKAEAEIARRGLLAKYARELERLLPDVQRYGGSFLGGSAGAEEPDYDVIGRAIIAPPEMRARAMLAVLKAQ